MEQSPLTLQPRPEVFQPKIVQLYDELLADEDAPLPSDGFWTEFFLLRPDRRALRQRLDALTPAALVSLEPQTRALFSRAVTAAAGGITEKTVSVPGTPTFLPNHNQNPSPNSAAQNRRVSPRSETAAAAALDTLCTFLSAVLSKKYTNPSSDVIAVLAGLDSVDTVLTEFVAVLDGLLRHPRTPTLRSKVVDVALATAAGAYQTTLLTYFIQRDLFPSIIRLITDSRNSPETFESFVLLGLLANYNKFEFRNPYQLRLTDFVNESAIHVILHSIGAGCRRLRDQYVDIQEDMPEGWTLANTLGLIGLGAIAPGPKTPPKPVYDAETTARLFAALPGPEAAVLLATYDFTHANKLFCVNLVTLPASSADTQTLHSAHSSSPSLRNGTQANGSAQPPSASASTTPAAAGPASNPEPPMASYISLASYLLQHAFGSRRTALYAQTCLMVFRLLVEDAALCRRMCSDESRAAVRLCRQRAPHLPHIKQPRPLAASVMDAMVDGLTHNLQRRLDLGLYTSCVGILLRLVTHLSRTRTRLAYHWAELFRALISLVRFLTTYATDVLALPAGGGGGGFSGVTSPVLQQGAASPARTLSPAMAASPVPVEVGILVDHVTNLLALGLSAGEAFLPTPAAYDDLFYKVVEAGDVLVKFRDTYQLGNRPTNSIETLTSVSAHYKQMLADGAVSKDGKGGRVNKSAAGGVGGVGGGAGGKTSVLTSLQVAQTIKHGYETLSIEAKEGLDSWEKYREADERMLLKKVGRLAVGDVKEWVAAKEE